MGIYNRDYMRDEDGYGGRRGGITGPGTWSVVTWLIVINVVVHIAEVLIFDSSRVGTASFGELMKGHVYLLLTYQFVHADFFHLLFNMLVLYFWGYQLKQAIGTKQFLGLYLGAGVFGGLLQMCFSPSPILGASAAVMGVVFGIISIMPRQVVNLLVFFVLPIRSPMWKIGAFIVAIELIMLVSQEVFGMTFGQNGIANLAHLGGAFFGWFWIAWIHPYFQKRHDIDDRKKRWSISFGAKKVVDAEVVETPKKPKPFVSTEIDAILDKISEQGMQSLTDEEKEILQKSSEKLSRRVDGK